MGNNSLTANTLNEMQRAFVLAYLRDKDRDATRAYIAAGYAARGAVARVNACKLMKHPGVQAEIQRFEADTLQRIRERAGVSLERTLHVIGLSAYADPAELFHEDGTTKAPHELSPEIRQAIEGIEFIEFGEGPSKVRKYKYKLASRASHRDMLMKHTNGYKADNDSKGEATADALADLLGSMRRSALPIAHQVDHDELF